jgi:ElaB/YqjD/DUF883 family membrane-anchored ribosome-binding protein
MNERIRELADQALKECDAAKERGIDQYSKRFAELIVKECAEIVKDSPWKLGNSYAASDQAWLIKEHFGVEE